MSTLFARSFLFVPGDKPALFDKACSSGADQVILDLEDAVGAANKAAARDAISRWLESGKPVAVRINGAEAWQDADLALCQHPNVTAVVVPKADTPEIVRIVGALLPDATAILPMIESARGLKDAEAIARAPGVARLLFGSLDFQADLGIPDEDAELQFFRSQLVWASRLAGVGAPVDGVTRRYDDTEPVRLDAVRARALGFGGKLCVHPRQVAVVNAEFSPTAAEVAWAERVVAADLAAGGGVATVDSEMIDRPVMLRARGVLERARS